MRAPPMGRTRRTRRKSQIWWFCRQLDILSPYGPNDPPIGRLSNIQHLVMRIERRRWLRFDPWCHGTLGWSIWCHEHVLSTKRSCKHRRCPHLPLLVVPSLAPLRSHLLAAALYIFWPPPYSLTRCSAASAVALCAVVMSCDAPPATPAYSRTYLAVMQHRDFEEGL